MSQSTYKEFEDSQFPALNLLRKLGWHYMSPEEAVRQRGEIMSKVILEDVLLDRLHAINSFKYKEKQYPFSEGNIHAALEAIKSVPDEGLVITNEKIYDLLTLGKSFAETIHGDRKSFTIKYIDWEQPENNVYHVTEEFEVSGINDSLRPDLVLFVNGIPFVVIENKRRDKAESVKEAISQHLRNQRPNEGIPGHFSLCSVSFGSATQ